MDGLESEPLEFSLGFSHLKRREAKESCIVFTDAGSGQLVQVPRYSVTGGQLFIKSDPLLDPGLLVGPELRRLLAALS